VTPPGATSLAAPCPGSNRWRRRAAPPNAISETFATRRRKATRRIAASARQIHLRSISIRVAACFARSRDGGSARFTIDRPREIVGLLLHDAFHRPRALHR
jgi:hypothetical protein